MKEETKAKISSALKGRKLSEEHRRKIAEANTKENPYNCMLVVNLTKEFRDVFKTVCDAEGITVSNSVRDYMQHKIKKHMKGKSTGQPSPYSS